MNNKGLIITLIVLLSIIIFLLVMFLVAALNGNFRFGTFGINLGKSNTNIVFDEKFNQEEVKNIEVLSNAGNVIFKESTGDNIEVLAYGKDRGDVKVTLEDNKLKVDYSNHSNRWISFNFYTNDIYVYVPKQYSEVINIDNNYGNCEIISLNDATINISCDCGNINIGKVKNANLKCDYGNIEVDTILNKCKIDADCGNVKIQDVQIKENSSIKCDLGDIKINKINDIFVDAKVDLGDVKIENNNRQSEITLKIDADCGNIKVGN